jgi:hypothetical protein
LYGTGVPGNWGEQVARVIGHQVHPQEKQGFQQYVAGQGYPSSPTRRAMCISSPGYPSGSTRKTLRTASATDFNYGSQQLQPIDQSSSQVQPPIDHADYSMAAQEDSISSNNTFCHQQFSLFHSLEFILDHRTSARDINNFRSRQFRLSHRLEFTLT